MSAATVRPAALTVAPMVAAVRRACDVAHTVAVVFETAAIAFRRVTRLKTITIAIAVAVV